MPGYERPATRASFRRARTPLVSRYDLFRRRLAPIAFVLAMGLLIRESCQKQQRTHATIHVDLPAQKAQIAAIDADVVVGDKSAGGRTRSSAGGAAEVDDNFGHLHRAAAADLPIDARPLDFAVTLPDDDGEVRFDLELASGAHKQLVRRFHASEGATIRFTLTDDDLR